MVKKLKQEIVDEIIRLYSSGMKANQVALRLNISNRTVYDYINLNGVVRKENTHKTKKQKEEELEVDISNSQMAVDTRRKRIVVVDGKKMVDVTDFMFSS